MGNEIYSETLTHALRIGIVTWIIGMGESEACECKGVPEVRSTY